MKSPFDLGFQAQISKLGPSVVCVRAGYPLCSLLWCQVPGLGAGWASHLPSWNLHTLCKVSYYCLVAKLCPTLCDPIDCNPPGSSVRGISQSRILEWVAIFFSRGSSPPRDRAHVSYIRRRVLYHWATRNGWVVLTQSCPALCGHVDCSLPGSSVHGVLQRECWSEQPFLSPGDFPDPGLEPASSVPPTLAGGFHHCTAWDAPSLQGSPFKGFWLCLNRRVSLSMLSSCLVFSPFGMSLGMNLK